MQVAKAGLVLVGHLIIWKLGATFLNSTTEWSIAEQKQSWISNDTELKMPFSNVRQTSISSYRVDVTFTDDEC